MVYTHSVARFTPNHKSPSLKPTGIQFLENLVPQLREGLGLHFGPFFRYTILNRANLSQTGLQYALRVSSHMCVFNFLVFLLGCQRLAA